MKRFYVLAYIDEGEEEVSLIVDSPDLASVPDLFKQGMLAHGWWDPEEDPDEPYEEAVQVSRIWELPVLQDTPGCLSWNAQIALVWPPDQIKGVIKI